MKYIIEAALIAFLSGCAHGYIVKHFEKQDIRVALCWYGELVGEDWVEAVCAGR